MIRYEDCRPAPAPQPPNAALNATFASPATLACTFAGGAHLSLAMAVIGPSGSTASISADEGNMIREGTDMKLFAQMEWTGTPNW